MRRKIKSSNALQALEEHRINRMLIENIHDADVNEATASAGSTGNTIKLILRDKSITPFAHSLSNNQMKKTEKKIVIRIEKSTEAEDIILFGNFKLVEIRSRTIQKNESIEFTYNYGVEYYIVQNIHGDLGFNIGGFSNSKIGFSIDLTKLGKQNYERKISYKNETDQIMAIYSPRKELKELNPTYTTRQLQEILRETSEINDFEFTEFYSIVEPTQLVITKRIEPIIKEDKGPSTTECLSNLSRDEIINLISD
ncbi:unnamed protein product [Rhizophagus irregularis]|nr:unnamed protein product [Rhizophagus irregularis]